MKFIKKYFDKLGNDFKSYLKKYPGVNISFLIAAIFLVISNIDDLNYNILTSIALFFAFTLNIELYFESNKTGRIFGYIIAFLLAICIPGLMDIDDFSRIYEGIYLISSLTAIYKLYSKQKNIFAYTRETFSDLLKIAILYTALFIGSITVFLILELTIIDIWETQIFVKIEYLLIILFFFPLSLFRIIKTNNDVPKFMDTLINKVLAIVLDIIYICLYIYIIKIVVLRSIPSNEVFAIVTFTFAFSLFMLLLLNNYKDKLSKYNCKYLPYLFIAPLLLQSYSLFLRISDYGLTSTRYIGIFILLFELSSFIFYIIKDKKYLKYDIIVLIIFSTILFIVPVINLEEAPIYSQIATLKSIWTEDRDIESFTQEEKGKIYSIYRYLYYNHVDKKYMPSYISLNDIEKLVENYEEIEDYDFYSFYYENSKIDVSGYKYIEEYFAESENEITEINGYVVDFSDIFKDLIKRETKEEYIIRVDEKTSLFVLNYEVRMNNKSIGYISTSGYIMTK